MKASSFLLGVSLLRYIIILGFEQVSADIGNIFDGYDGFVQLHGFGNRIDF